MGRKPKQSEHKDVSAQSRMFFDALYERRKDMVYAWALKLSRDEDHAKDIAQNVFMKVFQNLDKFQQGTNEAGWLYRITKNTFINDYRKDSKFDKVSEEVRDQVFEFYLGSGEAQPGEMGLSDAFVRAVQEVPKEQFLPFWLNHVEDFSYEEIAKILDCPIGTVRSKIHRAKNILSEALQDQRNVNNIQPM